MNNTLNNLALLSFTRKANKLNGTKIINNMNGFKMPSVYDLALDWVVEQGNSIYLWSLDNGFYIIDCKETGALGECLDGILSIEKYKDDLISHYGIYNPNEKSMTIFRSLFEDTNYTKPTRNIGRHDEKYEKSFQGLQRMHGYWSYEQSRLLHED